MTDVDAKFHMYTYRCFVFKRMLAVRPCSRVGFASIYPTNLHPPRLHELTWLGKEHGKKHAKTKNWSKV